MAYTALTFVSGEVLTAAKMNLLAANDASFHDGSGIANASIKASQLDWTTTPFRRAAHEPSSTIVIANTVKKIADALSISVDTTGGNLLLYAKGMFSAATSHTYYPVFYVDDIAVNGGSANNTTPQLYSMMTVAEVAAGSHTVTFGMAPNGTVNVHAYNTLVLLATEIPKTVLE